MWKEKVQERRRGKRVESCKRWEQLATQETEGREGKEGYPDNECLSSCQNPLMAVLKGGGRMCQTSGPLED